MLLFLAQLWCHTTVKNHRNKTVIIYYAAINLEKYLTLRFSIVCPNLTVSTVNKGWGLWSHLSVGKLMVYTMCYEEFSEKYLEWMQIQVSFQRMEVKYWETFSPLVFNLSVPRFAVLHKDFVSSVS